MDFKKIGIKKQVFYLVLGCSIITLLLTSAMSMYGILTTKNKMEDLGAHLGNTTKETVAEMMLEYEEEHLQRLLAERKNYMDSFFKKVAKDAIMVTEAMEEILSNPQLVTPQEFRYSKSIEDGWAISLAIAPSAVDNLPNLRNEIALAANIQRILKHMALSYDFNCSFYTAFEDGFDIVVDTGVNDMNAHYFQNPNPYYRVFNFFDRPWYQNAKEQNKLVFNALLTSNVQNSYAILVCSKPITVNGEFRGVTGIGFNVGKMVKGVFRDLSIDETGYCFILNHEGQVIVSPKTEGELAVKTDFPDIRKTATDRSLIDVAEKMINGEKGFMPVVIDGKECYAAFEPLGNMQWSVGAIIEADEIKAPAEILGKSIEEQTEHFLSDSESLSTTLIPLFLVALLVMLALISFSSNKLANSFVKPIDQLSDGVREIASGNLDKKIEIHTGNEIEHLADCFNAMTDELKTYMENLTKATADKERIATELNVATNIQISMLPRNFDFNRDDFEIYATMHAAKEVGGDFYDFYLLDENHLMITIADVSGKGVPAALFMANSKTILKNFAMTMTSPDDLSAVMKLANDQLCQGNDEMMFVTVFMGLLDLTTGRFIYVNGGHNPPMVYHKSTDQFEYMDVKQNIVLAMMDEMDFEQQEIQLENGDILYLYTDGVTEAMDINNNQYGEERLSKCLNNVDKNADLPTILKNVRDDLSDHVGEADQSDDITMLAVRLKRVML